MIDPMYTMIHKVILHIVPSHAMYADSLWNEVISFLHAEIMHIAALDVALESFATGLAVSSADARCARYLFHRMKIPEFRFGRCACVKEIHTLITEQRRRTLAYSNHLLTKYGCTLWF